MEWPGNLFWEEEQKLAKEFYSQFSEEEMEHVMTEEEEKEADRQFDQWMNEHASENLKLWRDYRRWIGDEGQLCDGNWHSLRHGDDDFGWIQEWDINEDGYCLYKGTNELILNTDGKPIKNPVLDKRIQDLFDAYDAEYNYD